MPADEKDGQDTTWMWPSWLVEHVRQRREREQAVMRLLNAPNVNREETSTDAR